MSSPLFCYNCGMNEDITEYEDNEYRFYQCSRCYTIIKKIQVVLLYDQKYQRNLGNEVKNNYD